MESTSSFGYWLRRRRKALDLTQAELAHQVGCSLELIQKIEADARRPSRQVAERLASCLRLEPPERDGFIQAARAERAAHHLALPSQPVAAAGPGLPDGTATFLVADLAESALLWARHPRGMPAAVGQHVALVRQAVEEHQGVIVTTLGDRVVAAFGHAPDALAAAIAGQLALGTAAWELPVRPLARVAIHAGDAVATGGDYGAQALNRATRLLAVGRGGQILLSLAAEELLRDQLPPGATLLDLGRHGLEGLGAQEQIFQLVAPGLPAAFAPLSTPEARRAALPAQPTRLVGREREVATICGLLRGAEHRLVTLTGPGGVGKTRLGLQVAAELAADFADGLTFVDLSPLRDPAVVATAIAQALGVPEHGARPARDRIKDALRGQRRLLLIDNFEQVAGAAVLVAEILAAAPAVKALVTSRVALNLRGEHEVRVEPLEFADPAHLPDLAALSQYAAMRLLIERALDARPGFAVTAENAPALAAICVHLDGLPLAIELAAARLKALSPEALLARLDRHVRGAALGLLVGGPRDLPVRQQMLRDTVAWSYDLLSPPEQARFRSLGIFAGGCTAEAAAAVGDPGGAEAPELEALIGHSLLRDAAGGAPRYVMLQTIREFALERLAASGELPEVSRRHALHFLGMAEETARALLWGRRDLEREELQAAEIDNLRVAMDWALERPEEPEIHLRLGVALKDFWWYRGLLSEGRRWRAALEAMPDPADGALMARALVLAGDMAWGQGENEQAQRLCARGLRLAAAAGDPWLAAFAHSVAGKAAGAEGRYQLAIGELEQSLAGFRALDDATGMAWSLLYLGTFTSATGDPATAAPYFRESLQRFEAANNSGGITEAMIGLAEIAIESGDLVRATLLLNGEGWADQGQLDAAGAIAVDELIAGMASNILTGDAEARAAYLLVRSTETLAAGGWLDYFYGPLFYMLGRVAQLQGDGPRAAIFFRAYLRDYLTTGAYLDYALGSVEGLATLSATPERGARLLGAAANLREQLQLPPRRAWQETRDRFAAALRARLGEAEWAAHRAAGAALTLEQAIAEALDEG